MSSSICTHRCNLACRCLSLCINTLQGTWLLSCMSELIVITATLMYTQLRMLTPNPSLSHVYPSISAINHAQLFMYISHVLLTLEFIYSAHVHVHMSTTTTHMFMHKRDYAHTCMYTFTQGVCAYKCNHAHMFCICKGFHAHKSTYGSTPMPWNFVAFLSLSS